MTSKSPKKSRTMDIYLRLQVRLEHSTLVHYLSALVHLFGLVLLLCGEQTDKKV
jgi:hypothetical protein